MTVPRNIFTCADYPNPAVIADLHSQTVCTALLCRACEDFPVCVAVMYLTLRTGCERHGRKNPLPFPYFAAVTCRQSAPDYPRERGENQRVETVGVYPLVRPRGVSAVPFASQATLCRSAPESKRGTPLTRSVPLCAYYWFLFS